MSEEAGIDAEFYLVPRNPDGTPSEFGEGLISAVVPGGLTFDTPTKGKIADDSEAAGIIAELAEELKKPRLRMPNLSPFLVLKRTDVKLEPDMLAACQCQCGGAYSCGGGGGGH